MTPRPKLTLAATIAAALVAAYLAGRWHARTPDSVTQETAAESVQAGIVEVFTGSEEWVTAREATVETHQVRDVYRERDPDGSQREWVREETGTKARETSTGAGTRTVEVEKVVEVEVDRWLERRVEVSTPADSWLVGPAVGFGDAGTMYGAMGAWRFAGPFHVAGSLLANGDSAVVGVGVLVGW